MRRDSVILARNTFRLKMLRTCIEYSSTNNVERTYFNTVFNILHGISQWFQCKQCSRRDKIISDKRKSVFEENANSKDLNQPADLYLRCPHMHEDTLSHGAANILFLFEDKR